MSAFTITGARVLDPASGHDAVADVVVADGLVQSIGRQTSGKASGETVDAGGYLLVPGLVDLRVSTGEPGEEHRETLATCSRAALRGGVTTAVLAPKTQPVIDDQSLVEYLLRRGRELPVNILVAGALTKGLEGRELCELGLMRDAGAVMFANGSQPVTDSQLLRRILQYAAHMGVLVAHPPVEPSLRACAHESEFSSRLGLPGEPGLSERIAALRDLVLAEDTGARLLLDIVSSAATLEPLRAAKARGTRVAATTTINHLALNELDIGDYRTFAKLDPPLRGEADRLALLAAVADGTIDAVVSDHDPQPSGRKRLPFAEAAPGAIGVELMLPVATTLAADGHIDLMDMLSAMTHRPADLLGLPSGRIAEGAPADLVLVDPDAPWVCDSEQLASLAKNTPFDDRRMTGRVKRVWVAGEEADLAG